MNYSYPAISVKNLIIGAAFIIFLNFQAGAATFAVDRTDDSAAASACTVAANDCSLRGAISAANTSLGADIIILSAGTYALSIAGTSEDANTTGDLDVTGGDSLTFNGASTATTIIDASDLDRVFDLISFAAGNRTITFNNLTIRNGQGPNVAVQGGGGIALRSLVGNNGVTTLTVNNSAVRDNILQNTNTGGGIFCQKVATSPSNPTVNIFNSTVAGNTATGTGGGVSTAGCNLNVENSLISGNTANNNAAAQGGGGIVVTTNATIVTIINSTISGNQTNGTGGGAHLQLGTGTITMISSTVANNRADLNNDDIGNGGGISMSAGTFNIQNSLIADNSDGTGTNNPDVFGTFVSQNYNHIENTAGGTIGGTTTNNTTGDPALGALANNGGLTFTHAPTANSPILDSIPSGANGCGTTYTTDQRGATRAADSDANGTAACEKGAVELGTARCGIQAAGEPFNYDFFSGTNLLRVNVTNDGTNLDCLRVTDFPISHPNATLTIQTGKYWTISPLLSDRATAAANDYTVNLTLPFAAADLNDRVCRHDGGGIWNCAANGFVPNTSITRNGITQLSDWAIQNNVFTAALVSISGRVTTENNSGVPRAQVILTDLNGNQRATLTNFFGYYRFDDIAVGETYTFQISHKRYTFTPQVLTVIEQLDDLNFIAAP